MRQPQPRVRNIYPVPSTKVLILSPLSAEIGPSTEYMAAEAIPTTKIYLKIERIRDKHHEDKVQRGRRRRTCRERT